MIRRLWTYVSNNALLATIIGGVVLLGLGTWRQSDVKAFLAGAGAWFADLGAWLMGTTEVYRLVTLAEFLVLAAFAWAALWWHRSRASGAPVVDRAPRVPADFDPTAVQMTALAVLLRNYDQITTLAQLYESLLVIVKPAGGKPFLAREMEQLARAKVVRIDETGRTDRSYSLTMLGRDWYLDQMNGARGHPENGPQGNPKVEPEEPARFAPETFALTGPRCRALLALLNRVDSITSLHDLHQIVTERRGEYMDVTTTKAQLQHDMDDAARAGLVWIEQIGTYTQRFQLTIPAGRDWVLGKQAELNREAAKGMTRRDPRSAY
jgi:hypothetical protein